MDMGKKLDKIRAAGLWLKSKISLVNIRWKRWLIVSLSALIVLTITSNLVVSCSTKKMVYPSVESIPYNKTALLLGTSKYLSDGRKNLYYQYRIEAVAALFHAHKVDYVIVSGDNSREDYDEPTDMKNDLVAAGIPAERIYLDYAGFRTLDSVVRCKEIFGQTAFTIVSQQFHNERAIYLARHYNIAAIGFNAKDVQAYYGFKTMLREKLARVKLFVDLLLHKKPKYLGEKVQVGD